MNGSFPKRQGAITQFREELSELIRARTPLFYLGSIETKRCLEEIRSVVTELSLEMQIFSLASGILKGGPKSKKVSP